MVGDEILSVNGVGCQSRANAIQMVRNIDEQLHLKIARYIFFFLLFKQRRFFIQHRSGFIFNMKSFFQHLRLFCYVLFS